MRFNGSISPNKSREKKPNSYSPITSLLFQTRAQLDALISAVAPCVVSSPSSSLGGTGGMNSEEKLYK